MTTGSRIKAAEAKIAKISGQPHPDEKRVYLWGTAPKEDADHVPSWQDHVRATVHEPITVIWGGGMGKVPSNER